MISMSLLLLYSFIPFVPTEYWWEMLVLLKLVDTFEFMSIDHLLNAFKKCCNFDQGIVVADANN